MKKKISLLIGIIASFVMMGMNEASAQTDTTHAANLQANFGNPPAQYRMGIRYWWWGDNVTRAELAWQLSQMKSQGIQEVEQIGCYDAIAAQSGGTVLMGSTQYVTNIVNLIEVADSLGMVVTVTPATAWPWCYGNNNTVPAGLPSFAQAGADNVTYASTVLTGPQSYSGTVPKPTSGTTTNTMLWQVTLAQNSTTGTTISPLAAAASVYTQNVNTTNATITTPIPVPTGTWVLTGYWLTPTKLGNTGTSGPEPENNGPEVGFEDSGSISAQLNWVIAPVIASLKSAGQGSLVGTTFKGIFCDNLEEYTDGIGPNFGTEFQALRGWNYLQYLPVQYYDATSAIGPKITAEYNAVRGMCFAQFGFGGAKHWANANGLQFRGEGHDSYYWADNYGNSDVPEMEVYGSDSGRLNFGQPMRGGADVFGRRINACESFTLLSGDNGTNNPSMKLFNAELNNFFGVGVNYVMMHGFTYSPSNKAWFENFRSSSNFNQWHPFFPIWRGFANYIANNQLLLQQGAPVVPILAMGRDTLTTGYIPTGVNGEVTDDPCSEAGFLQNKFTVSNGTINTPTTSYNLLIVRDTAPRFVETLRKLDTMIRAGANVLFYQGMVTGTTPYFYGGNYTAVDSEMTALKADMYDVITGAGPITVGAGKVWSTQYTTLANVITSLGIQPAVVGPAAWKTIAGYYPCEQRRGADYDLFFINNNVGASGTWQLNALGKPELWDAATGRMTPLNFTASGGYTSVSLTGNPYDSYLIMVRRDKPAVSPNLGTLTYTTIDSIYGTWSVKFTDTVWDTITSTTMTNLVGWPSVSGLYSGFAGIGAYSINFNLAALPDSTKDVVLDLGTLTDNAQVTINGTVAGYTWKPPYRVYATGLLKAGSNSLLVRVASRWNISGITNGLLGPVTLKISNLSTTGARPVAAARKSAGFSVTTSIGGRIVFNFPQADDYRIVLRDMRGRTVGSYDLKHSGFFMLSCRDFAPGIYAVEVKGAAQIWNRRVAIVH